MIFPVYSIVSHRLMWRLFGISRNIPMSISSGISIFFGDLLAILAILSRYVLDRLLLQSIFSTFHMMVYVPENQFVSLVMILSAITLPLEDCCHMYQPHRDMSSVNSIIYQCFHHPSMIISRGNNKAISILRVWFHIILQPIPIQ